MTAITLWGLFHMTTPMPADEPSISRLFFFAIFGLLGAFVCALRAGYHLYEERCILGAVWLCLGASVAIIMISFAWLL